VRVHLTDDGGARLQAMRAARTALLDRRLASFTADERAALAAALPLLDRLMEEEG
jgi:DNA-binding MarR family transcriptional regulator